MIRAVSFMPNEVGTPLGEENQLSPVQSIRSMLAQEGGLVQFPAATESPYVHSMACSLPNGLILRAMIGFYYHEMPRYFSCVDLTDSQKIAERISLNLLMTPSNYLKRAPVDFEQRIMRALQSRFPTINPSQDGAMSFKFADTLFKPLIQDNFITQISCKTHHFVIAFLINLILIPYTYLLRPVIIMTTDLFLRIYERFDPSEGAYLLMRLHKNPYPISF